MQRPSSAVPTGGCLDEYSSRRGSHVRAPSTPPSILCKLLILKEKAATGRHFSWPIPVSTPGCELDSVRLLEVERTGIDGEREP